MIKKFSLKLLLISSLFLLSSCFIHDIFPQKNTGPEEIRIVDLNGNPRPIQRFVPEGNARALAEQRSARNIPITDLSAPVSENFATNNLTQSNFIEQNQSPVNNLPPLAPEAPVQEIPNPQAKISYNMSGDNLASSGIPQKNIEPQIAAPKKPILAKKTKIITNVKSEVFIQIGSFSVKNNAQKVLKSGKIIFNGKVDERKIDNRKSYRVLLGPISDPAQANTILRKAKNNGYADAFIVK
ncbi:MAG: cell division protein FtsN [Rickettsiales bacterium]|jgi:cell division protein FtsN